VVNYDLIIDNRQNRMGSIKP